jgi:hypothetical protein
MEINIYVHRCKYEWSRVLRAGKARRLLDDYSECGGG